MKILTVVALVSFLLSALGASHLIGTSEVSSCPSLSGKWVLEGTNGAKEIVISVKQTECEIRTTFLGKEASLLFKGKWDQDTNAFKFDGQVTRFEDKCEMRVSGQVKLEAGKLKISVTEWEPNRCQVPDELRKELIWSPKPPQ